MSREDLIKCEGTVLESLNAGQFSVKLANGQVIMAKISGRLRKFHIRVLVGDRVTLGLSPYDVSHGLILSREKIIKSSPGT